MESNSSLRDLILITHEEYISLKRQEKTPDAREKQKQHLLSKFAEATQTNFEPIEENQFKTIDTAKELPEDSLVAQLNLNSRYHSGDSSTSNTVETKQSYKNPSDQVLSNLLQSGVTGGKVERSRQILKKIEDCERTTIDETNQTINLDQQDTGVSVVEFLSALQVNTKQLPKKFLTLVEVLRIPQFLLANTYARQTSNQNQHQIRLASGASPYKRLKLDTEQGSSSQWLTNF